MYGNFMPNAGFQPQKFKNMKLDNTKKEQSEDNKEGVKVEGQEPLAQDNTQMRPIVPNSFQSNYRLNFR